MTVSKRIILGAIGGITPYIATLLTIDLASVVHSYQLFDWIGLCLRCAVLIFLGSLMAYLHKSETEPFKIFQLGLAAPALIATLINGNQINHQTIPSPVKEITWNFSLVPTAHAQENEFVNEDLLRDPQVSSSSRFFRGLVGSKLQGPEESKWYVIVGSHRTVEEARMQVKELAGKRYKAKIYSPFGTSKYYSVAIAANVTLDLAKKIKAEAIDNGLPDDSFLWSY